MNKINFSSFKRLFSAVSDKGVQALVVTNFLGNVIRLLSNLVLARFLSPEAFAITGLASSVIFAFNMISDGGFRAFILRHKEGDEDKVLNTLWSTKLIRNMLLALLMFVFSDLIASFFAIDDLALVLKVLCLVFVIDAFLPISYISIERQNRVSTVMYLRFMSTLLSTIFSVIGVYYTQSYWPIVYSMVLNYVFQLILGYVVIGSKGTRFAFDKNIFVEFMGWAKFIIPSSIITLLLMQFDKLILGKTLTVSELGLYFVAFNFSSAAATFSIQYARSVLQPYLSIVYREAPADYKVRYYEKKMKIALLMAFSLGLLSGGSFVFFNVLYDDRYLDAGYYLSILLIMPVMALISYPSEISLILHGKLKMTLIANSIRLLWFSLAAWFGYMWLGVLGLLLSIGLIELLPSLYMIYKLKQLQLVSLSKELVIILAALLGFIISRSGHFLLLGEFV